MSCSVFKLEMCRGLFIDSSEIWDSWLPKVSWKIIHNIRLLMTNAVTYSVLSNLANEKIWDGHAQSICIDWLWTSCSRLMKETEDVWLTCPAGCRGDHKSKLKSHLISCMFDNHIMELILLVSQHAGQVRHLWLSKCILRAICSRASKYHISTAHHGRICVSAFSISAGTMQQVLRLFLACPWSS